MSNWNNVWLDKKSISRKAGYVSHQAAWKFQGKGQKLLLVNRSKQMFRIALLILFQSSAAG